MTDGKDLMMGTWNVERQLNCLDSSDFVSFFKVFLHLLSDRKPLLIMNFSVNFFLSIHLFLHLLGNCHIEVENLEV